MAVTWKKFAYETEVVTKSLFDANTILAATTDDTPAAVTVAEQRLVGRITSGNITALTSAQVTTLLGLGTISTQAADSVNIDGGAIDGTIIGANTAAAGTFTGLNVDEYIYHNADADTYLRFEDDRFHIFVGNVDMIDITEAAQDVIEFNTGEADVDIIFNTIVANTLFLHGADGKVFINDTANTKALGPSLTIDGAGQDGEYLTLQDSIDVAHGMTDLTDTDTFGMLEKFSNSSGGIALLGWGESKYGVLLEGYYTTSDVGKDHASRAPVETHAAKKSGTTYGDCGANDNVFAVRARMSATWRSVFIVDEDGDLLADGGVASTNMVTLYDDYEDAHLVRAFDIARSRGKVRGNFDKFLKYNENKLVELGILGNTVENGGLINVTRLQQLHNGAIWQNYTAIKEHDERLNIYERAFEKISQKLGIPKTELLALGN